MRRSVLLLALLSSALAHPAAGNEESQALGARALIELNAGRTQAAMDLLDRAVAADPNDADARYQRGATRAKIGDTTGAIEDMQAALAMRPNFPEAQLELGIALSDAGRYREAIPWLQRAQQVASLDAQASFFLGLAELRMGALDEAERDFERAGARDPSLAVSIDYYRGVIAYRRHDYTAAEARFGGVGQASPDSAMGREAANFLELIRHTRLANYHAFGTLALEYDSNVTLGPTTTVPGAISGQSDGRFVIDAGGQYVPITKGPFSLSLSYEFYQSLQFTLTDFSLQDNRPGVQLYFDYDRFGFGVLGRYDYYLRGTNSFLQETTAFPWAEVREPGIGRTELYARSQWRDYKQRSFETLNGFYNYAGVRQVIDLGSGGRQVWLGYELGFNDLVDNLLPVPNSNTCPNGGPPSTCRDAYQYGSQIVEAAVRWPLWYAISGSLGFRYEYQGYNADSVNLVTPPAPHPRHDNDYRVIVALERPLTEISEHLFMNLAYFGTFNDSNFALFTYNRQIVSLGAEVRF